MQDIIIAPDSIFTHEDVSAVASNRATVHLSSQALHIVSEAYKHIQTFSEEQSVYGLTSGVADLTTEKRDSKSYAAQDNLLLSHSAGVGKYLDKEVVRAMLFIRLIALSKGYSAVRPELLVFLTELLNNDVVPLVSSLGSIGLSDLTVLAETFLPILGKGQVLYQGKIISAQQALKKARITPLGHLASREGLALINNNTGTIGRTSLLLEEIDVFIKKSILAAALSMEGRKSTYAAYNRRNQLVKPFLGQTVVAHSLEKVLSGSNQITTKYNNDELYFLQDPPSFKTVAQNMGNAWDILSHAILTVITEINSITDNPLVPPDIQAPISSGNYYCAQLASAIDQLTTMVVQVSSTSLARIEILLNDAYNEGLPKYLMSKYGTNSGMMIIDYTARSTYTEMQALCYPRFVLSSKVANGWEDISTNAYNAVHNLCKVMELANEILTMEFCVATQANALRIQQEPLLKHGKGTALLFQSFRNALAMHEYTLPFEEDFYVAEVLRFLKYFHMQEGFLSQFISFFPHTMVADCKKQYNKNKTIVEKLNK